MQSLPPGFVLDNQGPTMGPPPKAPPPPSPLEQRRLEIAEQGAGLAVRAADRADRAEQRAVEEARAKPANVQAAGKTATLDSIVTQINRVQELYDQGIRDEGLLFGLEDYFPTGENAQFDTAGQGMADQGLAAFRVPGVGSQSDREAIQFAKANTPQASDFDSAIEEKIRNLRTRVDANRAALGLPPAEWRIGGKTMAEQERDEAALLQNSGGADQSNSIMNLSGGSNGGDNIGLAAPGAQTQTVNDPALAGIRTEYAKRLGANQSAGEIVKWLQSAGINDPAVFASVARQAQFRRQNPDVDISRYDTSVLDDKNVPIGAVQSGINTFAQSPLGTAIVNAGDAATGFNLDSISGAVGGNAEQFRRGQEELGNRNPGSALLGTIAGGALASLAAEAALPMQGARAALAGDAAYGAVAGSGLSDYNAQGGEATASDRVLGAGKGALASMLGSAAGQGLARSAGALGRGVSDPSVRTMQQAEVPLTLGQAVGNSGRLGEMVKGLEDRAAGFAGVGDVINARRTEGLNVFNSKTFDEALKPIGGSVGGKVAEEAVQEAQAQVSQAFDKALQGKVVLADAPFQADLTKSVGDVFALPRVGAEVADSVNAILAPYMKSGTTQIDGPTMQQISRELRDLKASYGNDPLKKRIGDTIMQVEDSIFGMFRRQAPEVLPEYNKAKQAYRRLSIVQDSVNKAKNREGVFTPAQLGMADRSNTVKYEGAGTAAAGKSPFQDWQRAAQETLPNEVPDSGTAGRIAALAIPAGIAGSGAGIGYAAGDTQSGSAIGLGLAGILAAAYTKGGQRLLTKATRGSNGRVSRGAQAVANRANVPGAALGSAAPTLLVPQQ